MKDALRIILDLLIWLVCLALVLGVCFFGSEMINCLMNEGAYDEYVGLQYLDLFR